MMQRTIRSLAGGLSLAVLAACGRAPEAAEMSPEPTPAIGAVDDAALLERGRYLTVTSGCNDCHSPGYAESGGTTPEAEWLVGSPLGWSGPWGTTYPANLRLKAGEMDEAAWLDYTADPSPLDRGRPEVWACAVAWHIASYHNLWNAPGRRPDDYR